MADAARRTLQALSFSACVWTGTAVHADQPFHPFAESMDVDPDYQWFAPADVEELEELSARKRANRGWFVTYDRLHIGFDRPDIQGQSSHIDMTWGNRWDLGFMGDSDKGVLFSFTHVSGPNVYLDTRIARTVQPDFDEEDDILPPLFGLIRTRFPFDPFYGDGSILERQSLNVGTLSSFEMNRTWRLEPYRYGGILEPMIGFRYLEFNDYAVNDDYFWLNIDIDPDPEFEAFTRQRTRTDNRMVTGQLGYRYFSSLKRMTFAQETRVFAGQNFQSQGFESRTHGYDIDGTTDGANIILPTTVYAGRDNSEFVIGLDARIEAALQLTKTFNVRAGGQMLYIGRGIWRGANPGFGNQNLTDQALISPAFTFGATLNR
jgi:hypothetical protein